MKWILGVSSLVLVALFGRHSAQEFQSRYPRVESYEIRPNILATPKYAADGTLCQVSIEKRHVQGGIVELGATMPRKLSLEMIDDLAPPSKRGKASVQLAGSDYISVGSGSTDVTMADYQSVSIQVFAARSDFGDTAIILKWKETACGSDLEPNPNRPGTAKPDSQQ